MPAAGRRSSRAPAEDDERHVGDRRHGDGVQRDPTRDLLHDLGGDCIPGARRGEDVPRVVGLGEGGAARPPGREPRRERRHGAGARIDVVVQPDEREVDLAGRPVVTAVELAAQDEAGAHAGADREEEKVVDTARDPLPLLAEGRQVDVVLEPDAEPEALLELGREGRSLEAGDARRERDRPALGVDDARHADDGAVQPRVRDRGRVDERVPQLDDLGEHALRIRPVDLDVEASAHVPAEVADRPAQEAAAEVETERERGLGNRLEEDRAVAGAGRPLERLADEAGVDERLEGERDGRLRDAGATRDLRTRDRRAGADRLEHRALVQVLEERRERGDGRVRSRRHLGWNVNERS